MSTSYGKNIKISIYGGSHDRHIGIYADGLPKGFEVDTDDLARFCKRRAPGKDKFSTPRKEADIPEFISGAEIDGNGNLILNGETLHAIIQNTSQHSSDYDNTSFVPRPSHADFAARMKYGDNVDLRGGGHFSGRLTAPLCVVGSICLQYLKTKGIEIFAHIYSIGGICDSPFDLRNIGKNEQEILKKTVDFPVLNTDAGERMKEKITAARESGDSVGGIAEIAVTGLPAGLGEHMYDGVEGRIAAIVFGIPAVKGIEFGNGFACASLFGSQNNDPFVTDGKSITTLTNNSGGILGGMTTGMPIVYRAAVKPTPSIFKEQQSVDMKSMTNTTLSIKGRHDPCILLRAIPVFEAATAIAVYDMLCDSKEEQ